MRLFWEEILERLEEEKGLRKVDEAEDVEEIEGSNEVEESEATEEIGVDEIEGDDEAGRDDETGEVDEADGVDEASESGEVGLSDILSDTFDILNIFEASELVGELEESNVFEVFDILEAFNFESGEELFVCGSILGLIIT